MGTTYRLIGRRLRVQRGPGNPDLVVERPIKETKTGYVFLDSDEEPTIVAFDELCQVDIPSLIQIGAIVEYVAPAPKVHARKVPAAGEEAS